MVISGCCRADVVLRSDNISYKCDICGRDCWTIDLPHLNHGDGYLVDELDLNESDGLKISD